MTTKTAKRSRLQQKMDSWEEPVPFTENFKWPGGHKRITFDTGSFHQWVEQCLPVVKTMEALNRNEIKDKGTQVGKFIFYLKSFPMRIMAAPMIFMSPRPTRAKLELHRGSTVAHCCFSRRTNIPVLCDQQLEPWMSLTPNEIFTQRGQIRRTRGRVAMAGLGLGWAARKVLERKQVKHLTVYETAPELIEFFGKSLLKEFGDRLVIVNQNAYEMDWSRYDVAIWDIWQTYGGAYWDCKFWDIKRAMEKAGKVCEGWGQGVQGLS